MVEERGQWGNQVQFLLTCVGFAVGLGNIWRFPSIAYENGGGAFLIPYLICSTIFGLPLLYLEFFVGQFTQSGGSLAFRKYVPLLQGIGWASSILAFSVGIYYNVVIVYCVLYFVDVIRGKSYKWTRCDNSWNTPDCTQIGSNKTGGTLAADEFHLYRILRESGDIDTFGSLNLPVLLTLIAVWTLTALTLVKGVKVIGKISYVTATLPYIIIGILFVRGVTLEGASIGLKYYLFQPDFSKLAQFKTWTAAANQMCYSLSIGFGGLLSLSSFNDKHHNCFRDALLVVFCDSFMSVFGGCAVFSILGFLSKKADRNIEDLIKSKGGLAFVAYPEAIALMPASFVWNFLLFLMFILLGVSSQFGYTQTLVTAVLDQFPRLRRHEHIVAVCACFVSLTVGLIMCWQSGTYWQNLFDSSIGGTTVFALVFLELLVVIHIYGLRNTLYDICDCMGGVKHCFGRVFGPSGYYFSACWYVVTPITALVLIGASLKTLFDPSDSANPAWAKGLGIFIQFCPLICIPVFAFWNLYVFKNSKEGWKEVLRIQPELPSYKRLREHNHDSRKIWAMEDEPSRIVTAI